MRTSALVIDHAVRITGLVLASGLQEAVAQPGVGPVYVQVLSEFFA